MVSIGSWWAFKNKSLNSEGLNIIKGWEGWSATAYKDVAGLWTIGYGHLINLETENYLLSKTLTVEEGEKLLRQDVERFENAVNNYVKVPITQNMFNSLVSFSYNVGVTAFKKSTLLSVLNNGDYIGAANQLSRWDKATVDGVKQSVTGLANRRSFEQKVFFS